MRINKHYQWHPSASKGQDAPFVKCFVSPAVSRKSCNFSTEKIFKNPAALSVNLVTQPSNSFLDQSGKCSCLLLLPPCIL